MLNDLKFYLLLILALFASTTYAQEVEDQESKYKINPYISASIGVVGTTANYFGVIKFRDKTAISEEIVLSLDKNNVNSFDRWALFQDPSKRGTYNSISDIGLITTFLAPVFLLADKRIKSHWLDIGLLYFETQTIAAFLYAWSPLGPQFIDRYRPETYYNEINLANRQDGQNRNSFFSGHTLITATGSFFIAKVICDFHPELGKKKWLVYSAALVPPAVVGYFRIKALRHFSTDTIASTVLGAAVGILIPHFHKKRKKDSGFSIDTNIEGNGIALNYRF